MAERKVLKWITVRGHHVPIYEDEVNIKEPEAHVEPFTRMATHLKNKGIETEEDIVKYLAGLSSTRRSKLAREMGIESRGHDKIKEMASRIYAAGHFGNIIKNLKSAKAAKEYTLEEKRQLLQDFNDRTGINVTVHQLNKIPSDTLDTIVNTVEEQLKKYGKDNFVLSEIEITEPSEEQKDEWAGSMSCYGKLWLNLNQYMKSKAVLEEEWKQQNPYHRSLIKAGSKTTIVHELGHARINNKLLNLWRRYGGDYNEWSLTYDAIVGANNSEFWQYGLLNDTEKISYRKGQTFRAFVDKFKEFETSLQEDKYLKKQWGGKVNLSLYGLVHPQFNHSDAISEYATTDFHEMCAEAYADVELNGDKASYMSKKVYERWIKEEW